MLGDGGARAQDSRRCRKFAVGGSQASLAKIGISTDGVAAGTTEWQGASRRRRAKFTSETVCACWHCWLVVAFPCLHGETCGKCERRSRAKSSGERDLGSAPSHERKKCAQAPNRLFERNQRIAATFYSMIPSSQPISGT
jgi:hypothetical protein